MSEYVELSKQLTTVSRSTVSTATGIAPRAYPQIIKYMGSKASILPFLAAELRKLHSAERPLVDLFAGAAAISGGFGHTSSVISNDIQEYSAKLASVYLRRVEKIAKLDLIGLAQREFDKRFAELPIDLAYPSECTLGEFNEIETRNRELLYREFDGSHHLFTRVYSGTWWSAEQCVWIDAVRQVLDAQLESGGISQADFDFGLACLMHAMAYTSQGTGHFAQYRDAKDPKGMADIRKYRRASFRDIFKRKFDALVKWNLESVRDSGHKLLALDYRACLESIPPSVVYADPPYAFVHYSRFYHALETIVKYDYPRIQHINNEVVKGRYREERHQSPFCIRTQVRGAFASLFEGVKSSESDLMLSYSNTGMICIEELMDLAAQTFGTDYDIWFDHMAHTHMTMGRKEDRSREVTESLILAKKRFV